jgi:hypothetical protein
MLATLAKGPLRMGPSMLADGAQPEPVTADHPDLPLAYAYADWTPAPGADVPEELGHYDPDTQTWVARPGVITAGNWTQSWNRYGRLVVDDACH